MTDFAPVDARPSRLLPIFISGSMSIRTLPDRVLEHLHLIIKLRLSIVIGDAPGVDAAVQRFLADIAKREVTVFCGGAAPRNNLGKWPVRRIIANAMPGTREWHTAKDREMSRIAGSAFVIWDGVSRGSYANIQRMGKSGRYVTVYIRPEDRIHSLSTNEQIDTFLASRLALSIP